MKPKVAFLGTPEAAVPFLRALAGTTEVCLVITRPDRPKGRSGTATSSPVKAAALKMGIPVDVTTTGTNLAALVRSQGPIDLAVVAAFGVLIPEATLAFPAHGFLNVHFSLLPRWRGASPVIAAIVAGDVETGVSIMSVDAGLDTGPVIAARATPIRLDETGGDLTNRLARIGAELLLEIIPPWLQGSIKPTPQDDGAATIATRIEKKSRLLDLSRPASANARWIRAMAPLPGASIHLDAQQFRVLEGVARLDPKPLGSLTIEDGRLLLGSGGTTLEIVTLQPPGRMPMTAASWIRGLRSVPALGS